jgi:hypothetical protein
MAMTTTDEWLKESSRGGKIRTVHIDTSLQIERCKEPKKAKIVERGLEGFGFKSTSSYAKFEFKCAWLRDLAYLYSCSQKVNRLEELLGYVNDKLNAHPANRSRVSRCLQGIESFLSKVPAEISYAASMIRLRSHIHNAILGAYAWWESSITHEYNGTTCLRASEQPRELSGGKIDVSVPRCSRDDIKCTIQRFFEQNKQHFIAIGLAIKELGNNTSEELQEAKKIIEDVEKNPGSLCDDSVCRRLGDVLIAVDGLNMDCFAANNDKEWMLLADVLGKELINPVRDAKAAN